MKAARTNRSLARSDGTLLWSALLFMVSCAASAHAPIVERFRAATCVPYLSHPRISPKTREWDHTLTLRNGSKVIVSGAAMVGGRVVVRYSPSGEAYVAANAGDYVYPEEVRFDSESALLYIEAAKLAGGLWDRTVLFEYDLRNRRLITSRGVQDSALPPSCTVQQ